MSRLPCILADLAAQHRRRAEELETASFKRWLSREVQPAVDLIWEAAIKKNRLKMPRKI